MRRSFYEMPCSKNKPAEKHVTNPSSNENNVHLFYEKAYQQRNIATFVLKNLAVLKNIAYFVMLNVNNICLLHTNTPNN